MSWKKSRRIRMKWSWRFVTGRSVLENSVLCPTWNDLCLAFKIWASKRRMSMMLRDLLLILKCTSSCLHSLFPRSIFSSTRSVHISWLQVVKISSFQKRRFLLAKERKHGWNFNSIRGLPNLFHADYLYPFAPQWHFPVGFRSYGSQVIFS